MDEVIDGLIEQIGIASFGGVAFVPSAKYRENLTDILKPALLAERQRAEVEKAELVREILNLPDFKSLIALAHPYAETLPDGERNTHFCKVTHQLEKALKAIATRNNIQV